MITIANIEAGSMAFEAGILPGDKILKMNEEEVRDRLDFEFIRAEEFVDFEIMRGSEVFNVELVREYGKEVGIEPEIMKINLCHNNCVFCFVYQNPKGMRKSLYVKDEDYRYSFLDGHFTTLSNMKQKDWDRVIEQQLSPLYVSVQATDPVVRARLLDNKRLEPILERLNWFIENQIEFHTQLVVVPDWNDGEVLEKSLKDLMEFMPDLLSVSVVPIGLTGMRKGLPDLRSFTKQDAINCLEIVDRYIDICKEKQGENRIFGSDELYVIAEKELPPPEFYGEYDQYQNGVGTLTSFKEEYLKELDQLPSATPDWEVTVLTAPIASKLQVEIMDDLKDKKGLNSEVIICKNVTFGSPVTVTGLLCGKDFELALEQSQLKGPILIPPNSLNDEGIFMDDMSPKDIEEKYQRKVIVPHSFKDYFPHY